MKFGKGTQYFIMTVLLVIVAGIIGIVVLGEKFGFGTDVGYVATPHDLDGDGKNDWIEQSDRQNTVDSDEVDFNIGLDESSSSEYDEMFTDDNFSDTEKDLIEQIGLDPDNVTTEVTTSGGKLVGNLAKTVTSFRTLAEAEEDMGYYLGLHNTIESHPELTLSGVYKIGQDDWYQALFEDASGSVNNITVKTSMTTSVSELIAPYNVSDYNWTRSESVLGVNVTFAGNDDGIVNLMYFDVSNGKAYSIYTSVGNEYSVMLDIVSELIENLQIMDDWKG